MKKPLMIMSLVILLCFTFGCHYGEEVVPELTNQTKGRLK